ncbi:MAG: twin-arginine translocation signal domain-containing protein, partial [Acidimicrobiia bacterium]
MRSPTRRERVTSTLNRRSFLARSAAATGALTVATPLQA